MITTAATVIGMLVVAVLAIVPWLVDVLPDRSDPVTRQERNRPSTAVADGVYARAA